MTTTPNPTAEQIVRATLLRCQFDTLGDKVADVVKDLRAHGLLSEGAPSEEQIERAARAFFREYHGEDIWPEIWDDGELDTRSRALAATRAALTAAGVAPQEPSQTETKSGSNFVSLDPEKVAAFPGTNAALDRLTVRKAAPAEAFCIEHGNFHAVELGDPTCEFEDGLGEPVEGENK